MPDPVEPAAKKELVIRIGIPSLPHIPHPPMPSLKTSATFGIGAAFAILMQILFAWMGWGHLPLPTPGPAPFPFPSPTPAPVNPAPIADAGLRVWFLSNYKDLSHPEFRAQAEVLSSTILKQFLIDHCVKGTDGKTPEYRSFDVSQTDHLANESPLWQTAAERKHDSLPWMGISNGKTGFEGPVPKSIQETIDLIGKYAQ